MAENKVTTVFIANTRELEAAVRRTLQEMSGLQKKSQEMAKTTTSGVSQMAGAFKLLAGAAIFGKMYSAVKEDTQATAKLNAVLKATGEVAGITQGSIGGIIKELHAYTGESDATLKNTAAVMLTFKNIGKDVFPDTMKATADLAAVMGVDLKSAAVQVGEALNDPATGMTALVRSGVTFSAEQQKQIKYFQSTNQLGKAQAIILKELQSQFGGAASAMNNTPIGMIETAFNQLTNALAKVMSVIMPVIGGIIGAIGDFITAILDAGPVVKVLAASVAVLIGALTGPIGLVVGLITAIGLLGSLGKSADDLKKEVKETKKGFDDLAKQDKLLAALKTTKQGTEAYGKTVAQITKLNPKLKSANLTTADSYNTIANKVNAAGTAQRKYLQSIAALQTQEVSKKLSTMLATLYVFGKASSKTNADIASLNRTLAEAAVLAGGSANAQFTKLSSVIKQLEADGLIASGSFKKLKEDFTTAANAARGVGKGISDLPKTADVKVNVDTSAMKKASDDMKKLLEDYKKLSIDLSTEDQKRNTAMLDMADIRASILAGGLDKQKQIEQSFTQGRMADIMTAFGQEQALQLANMTQRLALQGQQDMAADLLAQSHLNAQTKMQADANKKQIALDRAKQQALMSGAQTMFGNLMAVAQAGGAKMFKFYKAMAISQSIIAGIESGIEAFKHGMRAGGPVLAGAFLAASIAATGAQIAMIAKQKPPAAEYGGIIPPSAQGTIIAGEKNKAEAIIPLEGEGADRLRAAGFGGGATVVVDMKGAILAGDEIPEKIAQGIDKALYRLGLSNNSLVMARA